MGLQVLSLAVQRRSLVLEYVSVEDGRGFRICKPDEDELLIWTPQVVGAKKSKGQVEYLVSTQLRDFDQVFREYDQHRESESLAPDDSPCTGNTRGLLRHRPIQAIPFFRYIGKEVDGHAQDDVNVFSDIKPLECQQRSGNSGSLDPISIRKLRLQSMRHLMRLTRLGQHTVERGLRGERVHARARLKLMKIVLSLIGGPS